MIVVIRVVERRLGALLTQDVILIRREDLLPLGIGLGDLANVAGVRRRRDQQRELADFDGAVAGAPESPASQPASRIAPSIVNIQPNPNRMFIGNSLNAFRRLRRRKMQQCETPLLHSLSRERQNGF